MRLRFLFGGVFLLFFACVLFAASPEEELLQTPPEQLVYGIPGPSELQLDRKGFSLGYSSKTRQAVWVCYILSKEELNMPRVGRCPKFRTDPAVKYRPVQPKDYLRTGFDRGHLAPAADMAYSVETMGQSFFMTNISPQIPGCNRGIWKRLEMQIREWAVREEKLCIVTGPVFSGDRTVRMGKQRIMVPSAFYKVVLDMTPPMKMIGFIIPNAVSQKNIRTFAVTVDEVEAMTGLDFFSELADDEENLLEQSLDLRAWGIDRVSREARSPQEAPARSAEPPAPRP